MTGRSPSGRAVAVPAEPASQSSALRASIPNAAREAAEAEASKREKHKSKSLKHKRWAAVHDSVKGWHVALVDDAAFAEQAARAGARSALMRGDLEAFQRHAADALLARCARTIDAAQAIEARRAETLQDGSVHESAVGETDAPMTSGTSPFKSEGNSI